MENEKLKFLREDFIFQLRHLSPDEKGKWGQMNGQQMIEHFTDAVRNANGKLKLPVLNEGERLVKFREFLMSDRPFSENTRNPLLSDTPTPIKHSTIQEAIAELQVEIEDLVTLFESKSEHTTSNPFFGDLNFEEVVQLLHKHASHHLRQFGLDDQMTATTNT